MNIFTNSFCQFCVNLPGALTSIDSLGAIKFITMKAFQPFLQHVRTTIVSMVVYAGELNVSR